MPTISIYHEGDNRYYQVVFTLSAATIDNYLYLPVTDTTTDYFLTVSTNVKKRDGSSFPTYMVRTLADVPTGYATATTFTDLVNKYVDYFIVTAEFTLSSSSSSNSSSYSSTSSSKSSSTSSSHSTFSSSSSSKMYSSYSSVGHSSSTSSKSNSSSSSTELKSSSSKSNSSSSSTEIKSSSSTL